MAQKNFTCGDQPLLTIRAAGNISLRAGVVTDVAITIERLEDLLVTETKNGLTIVCDDDCILTVPEYSRVAIDEVGGNVSVADLKGNLYLTQIDGNATLSNVGDAAVKKVDGNLRLDGAGNVTVEQVDGNLKGSGVSGPLNAVKVDGNIKVGSVGSVGMLTADGNIEIGIREISHDVEISADGNIYLELPDHPNFILDADVDGSLNSQFGPEMRKFNGTIRGIQFGSGGPVIKLSADGNVTLSAIGAKAAKNEFDVSSDDFGGVKWRTMNERLQRRIDERIRKAERKAEAVQRKAERHVREAMKSVEGLDFEGIVGKSLRSAGWPFSTGEPVDATYPESPETEPAEEREKVTDAERMLVLNMLHEKKITAEEAERLLDALEGKFHNQ